MNKKLTQPKEGRTMRIEYRHASKYGNGAVVAKEFKRPMDRQGG
jgi:hypothetical protein